MPAGERALIYKTVVLTGLRKGELASLTAAHLRLEDAMPYLTLDAADEKNREGNDIPLGDWLADKLRGAQDEARQASKENTRRRRPRLSRTAAVFHQTC